jgi:DNA methylase
VKPTGNVGGYDPASGARFRPGFGAIPNTRYLPVAGDDTLETAVDAFRLLSAECPAARHVWWGGNHYAGSAQLADSSCWLVWDKENTGDFADCELAWTSHSGAVRIFHHMWNGMLRASERGKRVHPTQKPVALAEWAFGVIDPKNERKVVLDTFAGSGSTLIAAHNTGRAAALIEMEPAYVDVIARRWEQATGIRPERVRPDGTAEPVSFL